MEQSQASLICATVCVGVAETRYTRAGSGDPVVILAEASGLRPVLMAPLSRQFRVMAPELCEPAQTSAEDEELSIVDRVTGFVDCLGLSEVSLVADERFGAAAIALALAEPERVRSVAVLLMGSRDAAPADRVLRTSLRMTREDLLLLWLDPADRADRRNAQIDTVAAFLANRQSMAPG